MNERSTTSVDKRIGLLLRRRRLELEISQERLAAMLGVTFQQIQKYEKGVNRIAASRLFEICKQLDTSPGYFYTANGQAEVSMVDEALAEPETVRLLTSFAAIKDRGLRKRVLDLVRALESEAGEAGAKRVTAAKSSGTKKKAK